MQNLVKAYIDLSAIEFNFLKIKNSLDPGIKICPVIKADAYGHGAAEVAKVLEKNGADYLAVISCEEGVTLREAGIKTKILVMGAIMPYHIKDIVKYELEQAIFNQDNLILLNEEAKRQNKIAKIQLKLDTGLHRLGIDNKEDLVSILKLIKTLQNVELTGAMSHFAMTDTDEFSEIQAKRFIEFRNIIKQEGFNPIFHQANTDNIGFGHDFDMVRTGIALFGYSGALKGLKPALSLKTNVVQIKQLKKGEGVSYGLTFIADRDLEIAILPVGYSDGYLRSYAKDGKILINGNYCPILGRICMNMMIVDITSIDVKLYDEAILIGVSKDNAIWADEIAKRANTISYEVLTSIAHRVPRIYLV